MPDAPSEVRRNVDDEYSDEGEHLDFVKRFIEEMDDDFNSAGALAVLHDLVRSGNKLVEGVQRGDESDRAGLVGHVEAFLELTSVLNLQFESAAVGSELTGNLIEFLLELRDRAREEKAFERADAIRAKLGELGVSIEDTPAGTRWRV